MIQYDPSKMPSFDNGYRVNNSTNNFHVKDELYQPIVKQPTQLQPGNHQINQSLAQRGSIGRLSGPIYDHGSDTQSRIDQAKAIINEKFQKMVEWGNLDGNLPHQPLQNFPDSVRSIGKNTRREINQDSRNQPADLENRQISFGLQYHNIFTPPASKQFKLALDDQGRVIPATVRGDAEGEIPIPKKSPSKLTITKQASLQQRPNVAAISRNIGTTAQELTINPKGQHGVVAAQDSARRRVGVFSSAKSTKSLKDLLSYSNTRTSASKRRETSMQRLGKPPMAVEPKNQPKGVGVMTSSMQPYSTFNQIKSSNMSTDGCNNQSQQVQKFQTDRQRRLQEYPCSSFFQSNEFSGATHHNINDFLKEQDTAVQPVQNAINNSASKSNYVCSYQNATATRAKNIGRISQGEIDQANSMTNHIQNMNHHDRSKLNFHTSASKGDGIGNQLQLQKQMSHGNRISASRMNHQTIAGCQSTQIGARKIKQVESESVFCGRPSAHQPAKSFMDDQFIITMHPAGNTQGEESGMHQQVRKYNNHGRTTYNFSPAQLKEMQMQRSSSPQTTIEKSISSHQASLTARKNFSSQHLKMTPLANKLNQRNQHTNRPYNNAPSYQVYQQNKSPNFPVIQQQRQENSSGRCSISSINLKRVDEDLPPEPSMQTRTIEKEESQICTEHDKFTPPFRQPNSLRQALQSQMMNMRMTDQQQTINLNEIKAVAPKKNQMSHIEQASSELSQSILVTQSEQESSSVFKSSQLAMSIQSPIKAIEGQVRPAAHRHVPVNSPNNKMETQHLEKDLQANNNRRSSNPDDSTSKVNMVRVEDEAEEKEMKGLSERQISKKKRENSFIRDGYEIYVEGTYIVNGRKKKKIKKRKLSKAELENHQARMQSKTANSSQLQSSRRLLTGEQLKLTDAKQLIEQEMKALDDLTKQTMQMDAAKKMVTLKQSQISLRPMQSSASSSHNSLNVIKLMKQTGSQPTTFSRNFQHSPRITKPIAHESSEASNVLQDTPDQNARKQVTKVKIQGAVGEKKSSARTYPMQRVPRSLFVKNSPRQTDQQSIMNEEASNNHAGQSYSEIEESKVIQLESSEKSLTTNQKNQLESSQQSINLRDPELQLMTSNRPITLQEISKMLGGAKKFLLHRMIFEKRFAELLKLFRSGLLTPQILNERDHQGNTPLLLAAKLSAHEDEYLRCINFLFKEGCDGKLRDGNGWSILDEAICQSNPRLLAIAFQWLNQRKKEKIQANKAKVLQRLLQIPDFYCELHWECQSSWIPFLSKLAPSDNFQIWKVGSNIRLDFSLVGFKKLQNKRRRMSILFRNAAADEKDERYKDIDILMVNRDREILSNPLEDLDEDEKLAVLTDIMNADPVQNELNIVDQTWEPVQNFFGTQNIHETVNGYDCSRYKLQIMAQVRSKKKLTQQFKHSYETYFQNAEEFVTGQKATSDPNSFKMAKDVEKSIESQLWLSQEFPLQFTQFMEVLDTLAISGQASMQKINEFLQNDCLKDVVNQNGFPVKIQVPIGMIVKAMVTFGNFQYLNPENKEQYIKETFQVPDYCNLVSRKVGMKTLESKKKRLAVANVVI